MKSYRLSLWQEDRLLFIIVLWMAILSSWMWWVPIRCVMDGPAFEWMNEVGYGRIGGAGMGGDFLVLALLSTLFITIVFMGFRGAQGPFKPLLFIWCAVNVANSTIVTLENPGANRFRGDTMGIDISLGWSMVALKGALLLAVMVWLVRDFRRPVVRAVPQWIAINSRFLIPVLVILPFQIILLRFGPMHDITDKLGWILTYTEWVLLMLAFMPWALRESDTVSPSAIDSSAQVTS